MIGPDSVDFELTTTFASPIDGNIWAGFRFSYNGSMVLRYDQCIII